MSIHLIMLGLKIDSISKSWYVIKPYCSVSVRVRPLSDQEAEKGSAWKIENNQLLPLEQGHSSDNAYTLDNVFGSEWSTQAVYDHTTEDIIKKVAFSAADCEKT